VSYVSLSIAKSNFAFCGSFGVEAIFCHPE
jgi:hypothetical protein